MLVGGRIWRLLDERGLMRGVRDMAEAKSNAKSIICVDFYKRHSVPSLYQILVKGNM